MASQPTRAQALPANFTRQRTHTITTRRATPDVHTQPSSSLPQEEAEKLGNLRTYQSNAGNYRQCCRQQRTSSTNKREEREREPHLEEMELARYFMSSESPRSPWTSTQMCSAGLVVRCTSRSVKNGRLCSLQSPHTICPLSSSCIARTFDGEKKSRKRHAELGRVAGTATANFADRMSRRKGELDRVQLHSVLCCVIFKRAVQCARARERAPGAAGQSRPTGALVCAVR